VSGDLEDGPSKGQQCGLCRWTGVGGKLVNGPFLGPTVGRCAPYTSTDPLPFSNHLSPLTIQIVTLNMEAVGSSETSENMSTTRHMLTKIPKNNSGFVILGLYVACVDLWVGEKTVVSVTNSVNKQRIILHEVVLRIMVFNFYQWIDFCLRNVCGQDVIHKDPSDSD